VAEPQIVMADPAGVHNADLPASLERLRRAKSYRDLSTIIVVPALADRGIPPRVVERWMGLMTPMNQPCLRMFVTDMEVGAAYNAAVEAILANPVLSTWKYLLTLEHDNMPPVDGLLRLYESIDDYAAVGGLYWTKGPDGQPMIYGDPTVQPLNFVPQLPVPETVQECNGLGMGFTLFDLDVFRKVEGPWFRTVQEVGPGGAKAYTQDLWFFQKAREAGYRVACDTRVRVGHLDVATGVVW